MTNPKLAKSLILVTSLLLLPVACGPDAGRSELGFDSAAASTPTTHGTTEGGDTGRSRGEDSESSGIGNEGTTEAGDELSGTTEASGDTSSSEAGESTDEGSSGTGEAPLTPDPNAWYQLRVELHGAARCFEGNDPFSSQLGGSAYMDECQDVAGQRWRFESYEFRGETWWLMKNELQGDDRCLEGNDPVDGDLGGNAFVYTCGPYSGQMWELVPDGEWYHLKTRFQGPDRCLEGNDPQLRVHGGGAFLDLCGKSAGQRWELVEVL